VRDGFETFSYQKIFAEGTNGMSLGHPSATVPPIFIGKWTPRILFSLKEGPYRHGQLRRRLGSISQRMLTRTLRNLEATGLIARQVTRSNSVAVEYSLTRPGRTLIAPLRGMCRWAKRYQRVLSAEVHLHGN
jgi:DNA-binding HxlR family transcriptional regulator